MIQVTHDSVLDINGLVSSINLSEEKIELLKEFEKIRFSVLDYSNSEFTNLLEDILSNLQESYKIYLIYIESKAQPTNKIRSFKKMFYSQRKEGVFTERELYEKEVAVSAGKSILISSIKLTESNRTYILNNLLNTNFKFGYLVKKDKRSFTKNIESFLENVIALLSDNSSTSRINFVELLLSEVKRNKNIFRIPYGVNEKDYLEFLIRKEDENVSKKLSQVEKKYKSIIEN